MVKRLKCFFRGIVNDKIWLFISIAFLVLICIVGGMNRYKAFELNMPYSAHVDESFLTVSAKNIIINNDLNPHYFHYPSLPIYLISAGFVLGYLHDAPNMARNGVYIEENIGRVTRPYYDNPQVVLGAKYLFSVLSVLAFIFISYVSYRAYETPAMLMLPALILSISPLYFSESWLYLNVDIIGAVMVSLFYFSLYLGLERDTYISRSIIPGFTAGMVIASKYTLFPIMLIPAIFIFLIGKEDRLRKAFMSIFLALITFFFLTPYAIFDVSSFLSGVAFEINHYSSGHGGSSLSFAEHFVKNIDLLISNYGYFLFALGLVGVVGFGFINWKHCLILLAFPFMLLIFMSSQKVYFSRNMLPFVVLYPIFISFGILFFYKATSVLSWQIANRMSSYFTDLSAVGLVVERLGGLVAPISVGICIAIFLLLVPINKSLYPSIPADSRNIAVDWIKDNIAKGERIIVAAELGLKTDDLEKDYRIEQLVFRRKHYNGMREQLAINEGYIIVPEFDYIHTIPKFKKYADIVNNGLAKVMPECREIKQFGVDPLFSAYTPLISGQDIKKPSLDLYVYMPVHSHNPKFTICKKS